jgi:alkylhydroperoxidase family enzyme
VTAPRIAPGTRRDLGAVNWMRAHLSETELIELCLLVGHYEMLAMTINSLGIEPEAEPEPAR